MRKDGTICSLPDLPSPSIRSYHSQSGLTICGGKPNGKPMGKPQITTTPVPDTCIRFKNGFWNTTHILRGIRRYHCSWNSPEGILLIGGTVGNNASLTTELLSTTSSTTTPQFDLDYHTRYVLQCHPYY